MQSRSLVRVGALPERVVSEAEQRLAALVARLAGLEAEHRELVGALEELSERCDEHLGASLDEVARVERVCRRLEQLEAQLSEVTLRAARAPGEEAKEGGRRVRSRRAAPGASSQMPSRLWPEPELREPEADVDLKDLYRSLARRSHPDLAQSHEERARRSRFMSQLNAAYADEDRVRLELLASEIDAQSDAPEGAKRTRDEHAERRIPALGKVIARLERDVRRLRASGSFRRLEQYREREARREDYFAEERRALSERARTRRAGLSGAAKRVEVAVQDLNAALGAGRARAWRGVPFREAVVSPGRLTVEGARFRDALGRMAREAPWKAAWVIAAFFAEVAERPPEGLRSMAAWAERHESLRPLLGRAPAFDEALTELPPALELGCRVYPSGARFGIQLRDPLHVAGVAAALSSPECRVVGADVLRALGKTRRCVVCRRAVPPVHLYRVREPDPLHALVCARCGTVLESYRSYGRPEGLEALAPYALSLGVVGEAVVSFGGAAIRLGMLSEERRRLTAGALAERFTGVVLDGLPASVASRPLRVKIGREALAASACVPVGARVTVVFAERGEPGAGRVVELLRARRAKRLRPS